MERDGIGDVNLQGFVPEQQNQSEALPQRFIKKQDQRVMTDFSAIPSKIELALRNIVREEVGGVELRFSKRIDDLSKRIDDAETRLVNRIDGVETRLNNQIEECPTAYKALFVAVLLTVFAWLGGAGVWVHSGIDNRFDSVDRRIAANTKVISDLSVVVASMITRLEVADKKLDETKVEIMNRLDELSLEGKALPRTRRH